MRQTGYEQALECIPKRDIAVSDPINVGKWKKYTVYLVSSTQTDLPSISDIEGDSGKIVEVTTIVEVRRRYRHFVWLREVLCAIFDGTFIPPLPEKKLIGRMDESFVTRRQRGLQKFLNRLAEKQMTRLHPVFVAFLTEKDDDAFQQLRQQYTQKIASLDREEVLRDLFRMTSTEFNVDDVYPNVFLNNTRVHLTRFKDCLENMLRQHRKLCQKIQEVSTELGHMGDALELSAQAEEKFSVLCGTTYTDCVSQNGATLSKCDRVTNQFPTHVSENVEGDIFDYLIYVREFIIFLKAFEERHRRWEKFSQDYIQERLRIVQIVIAGDHRPSAQSMEAARTRLQETLSQDPVYQEARLRIRMSLVILMNEIDWFYVNRSLEMRIILGQFSALWHNYFSFMGTSFYEQLSNTTAITDDLPYRSYALGTDSCNPPSHVHPALINFLPGASGSPLISSPRPSLSISPRRSLGDGFSGGAPSNRVEIVGGGFAAPTGGAGSVAAYSGGGGAGGGREANEASGLPETRTQDSPTSPRHSFVNSAEAPENSRVNGSVVGGVVLEEQSKTTKKAAPTFADLFFSPTGSYTPTAGPPQDNSGDRIQSSVTETTQQQSVPYDHSSTLKSSLPSYQPNSGGTYYTYGSPGAMNPPSLPPSTTGHPLASASIAESAPGPLGANGQPVVESDIPSDSSATRHSAPHTPNHVPIYLATQPQPAPQPVTHLTPEGSSLATQPTPEGGPQATHLTPEGGSQATPSSRGSLGGCNAAGVGSYATSFDTTHVSTSQAANFGGSLVHVQAHAATPPPPPATGHRPAGPPPPLPPRRSSLPPSSFANPPEIDHQTNMRPPPPPLPPRRSSLPAPQTPTEGSKPPPPPPPPPPTHPASAVSGSDRTQRRATCHPLLTDHAGSPKQEVGDLLAQVRSFRAKSLRQSSQTPVSPQRDSRTSLLEELKGSSVRLKKTEGPKTGKRSPRGADDGVDALLNQITGKMSQLRRTVGYEDAPDANDDDDEWKSD